MKGGGSFSRGLLLSQDPVSVSGEGGGGITQIFDPPQWTRLWAPTSLFHFTRPRDTRLDSWQLCHPSWDPAPGTSISQLYGGATEFCSPQPPGFVPVSAPSGPVPPLQVLSFGPPHHVSPGCPRIHWTSLAVLLQEWVSFSSWPHCGSVCPPPPSTLSLRVRPPEPGFGVTMTPKKSWL